MQVVDISDPTHPTLVGAYQAPGQVEHVAVSGQTAYLLDPDSLWAVDIRDPANPRVIRSYDMYAGAPGVAAVGDVVYLAYGDLLVLDASDPANLSELASYELGEYNAQSLDICGGYAFMDTFWEMGSELVVIDLSDPANPVKVGAIEDAGWNYMAEADGVIYTAALQWQPAGDGLFEPARSAGAGALPPQRRGGWPGGGRQHGLRARVSRPARGGYLQSGPLPRHRLLQQPVRRRGMWPTPAGISTWRITTPG